MRERGSNTAHPTEKGGGGLQIRSRFGWRTVDSAGHVASFRADSVAIRSIRSISSRRFGRFRRAVSCRHQRQDTKKARFLNRGIGLSYRKVSRALKLRLIPLSNTRVDVRIVLLGLARRSCIVMLTSGRRHIVHYT